MAKKIFDLPKLANPTIEKVLDEFLADQHKQLRPRMLKLYDDVIGLLKSCFNSYAYQSLAKAESALFEKHFDAEGEQHRYLLGVTRTFSEDKGPKLWGFLTRDSKEPVRGKRLSAFVAGIEDQPCSQGSNRGAGRNPVTAETGNPEKAAHLGIPADHEATIVR